MDVNTIIRVIISTDNFFNENRYWENFIFSASIYEFRYAAEETNMFQTVIIQLHGQIPFREFLLVTNIQKAGNT